MFEVVPPDVDEDPRGETDPVTLAGTLARRKAAAVLAVTSAAYVLAADTVVWARGEILGKPTDDDDARRMLRLLSGTAQRVVTGFAAARTSDGRMISGTVTTIVVMRELSEADVDAYVATREHEGKAGAYAIQESADRFVTSLVGPFDNVVGLPVRHALAALEALGFPR